MFAATRSIIGLEIIYCCIHILHTHILYKYCTVHATCCTVGAAAAGWRARGAPRVRPLARNQGTSIASPHNAPFHILSHSSLSLSLSHTHTNTHTHTHTHTRSSDLSIWSSGCVQALQAVPHEAVRPFKSVTAPRLALGRTEFLHELYGRIGSEGCAPPLPSPSF